MGDKFKTGPAFTMHVPVHPFGTDPSQTVKSKGQPLPVRQTQTFQFINRGNGSGLVGLMTVDGLTTEAAEATITVTHANVTPGTHVIRVGRFELRPSVDFAVGGGDAALATNLAAAITALPGFTASPLGAVVTVNTTTGHGDDHRMEIVEWGPASAFALGALERTGYMDRGTPTPEEPDFS